MSWVRGAAFCKRVLWRTVGRRLGKIRWRKKWVGSKKDLASCQIHSGRILFVSRGGSQILTCPAKLGWLFTWYQVLFTVYFQCLPTLFYRPGQPHWEYTMWDFQDSSATQILREINFGHFEAPNLLFDQFWNLSFQFLGTFDIFKCEICPKIKILSLPNCQNSSFWHPEMSQN